MTIIDIFTSGLQQGIIWAILVIGVYISFRILDFADLSIEGTFPLGACTAAVLIFAGCNPYIATILAMLSGMLGGLITGLLHTKLKIPAILSGIITMTALYSINLVLLGLSSKTASTLSTLKIDQNVFQVVSKWLLQIPGFTKLYANMFSVFIVGLLFLTLISSLIYWLFGTEVGMSVRATGNNPKMARAQGINTDLMIIFGLVLSNGLIALSGALFAQDFGAAVVDSGRGAIVIGLAAIILGEIIFGRRSFKRSLISIIIGSIIFFIIKAVAIELHVDQYLNLMIAIMIAVILALPLIKTKIKTRKKEEISHA